MASIQGTPTLVSGEAEAIQKVADLAIAGTKPEIVMVPTSGLGDGLPAQVPALLKPATPGGQPGALLPVRDLIEGYRLGPARRTGTARVTTLDAFIALVNRHKDAGSVIFAKTDWPNPALTAIIDYHSETNAPRHGEHRIAYAFPVTPEFQAWIAANGTKMGQGEFAQFLEEHAAELAAPYDAEVVTYERLFKAKFATPNELIDLARSLEIHVNAQVKNAVRLQSGEGEVVFREEHVNGAGEKVTVPGVFMISLRSFVDGEAVRIPARLRYRVSGGAITWSFQLYRWEDELRARVQHDLMRAADETGLPSFEGAPEGR
ncbi:hypothetical protein VQ02_19790 [Methylobacterium variabile]|uniref:DUF2303 domain-containing protein n=1 Tax=Methylobacterium variabile TaxID=298794 RepID=A0A0J6SJR2_9HYPH|nr:DUF2303 family protein [Methylobacterium variabile]KMO33892.1 hypothetical protein VQ02_19790 [Methylobacterium variabile]